jgi:hypothetical protein
MRTFPAHVGALGVDSLPFSQAGTLEQAKALRYAGVKFLVGYLGVINAERLGHVLNAGLAFMPVTLAGEYNDGPEDEVKQLQALGLPKLCSVWLDLEGLKAFHTNPVELITKINTWADAILAAGYMPCLYVGVPQPLTSDELWNLRVKRYWRGQGSVRDRFNALAEPTKCGWTMTQMYPQHSLAGVWVDVDVVGQDYLQRVPNWVVA